VLTTSGSAERLQKSAGAWKLEFQQLVYNTPTLLRPRRFAVLGEQAILQQLREFSGHEPLAKDAERLFLRPALNDGAYVVRDGRWFPELRPETVAELEPPPQPAAAGSAGRPGLVDELVKRIASLESMVDEMRQSLDKALAALGDGTLQLSAAPAISARSSLRAAPAASSLRASPVSSSLRAAASASQAAAAERPSQRSAASSSAPPARPAPIPMPDQPGDDKKVIALPPLSALSDVVKGLAGPDATLASSERFDWEQVAAKQPVFCSVIQDNGGDEAGSMIFDLESALRMAGALLMESDEVVESLLEEKVMSDDMLDAASEVCNTLMSAFNKVSGNPHMRVGKMQPLSEARMAQLAVARKRDDYRYSQGGRLTMIGR
jgi:hypothetical protein